MVPNPVTDCIRDVCGAVGQGTDNSPQSARMLAIPVRRNDGRLRAYFVALPPTASLRALVELAELAHQRWAIEQQYQEVKDELGLDHFERCLAD